MAILQHSSRLVVLLAAVLCATLSARAAELPAWIIEVPAAVQTILVADVGSATLHEYRLGGDRVTEKTSYYMSIGSRGVRKLRAGDNRTPLGTYFIVAQLDTSRLDAKYGITAFPLDYPNELDRRAGRTGDGIWLHGVLPDTGRRPELDTDGCIALPNEDLARLAARLVPTETPVLITRRMSLATDSERQAMRPLLRNAVRAWRDAIASGDILSYLSLYAQDFKYRGLSRDEWAAMRLAQFSNRPHPSVDIEELLLIEDPEEPGLYLARFKATTTLDSGRTTVRKRLYWRQDTEGQLQVVAEDNG